MSETDVDFARLFKDVSRTVPCEKPGHDEETQGCLRRYTEATWAVDQLSHGSFTALVCVGYAVTLRSHMENTMTCPLCGTVAPLSSMFRLRPLNLPSVIDER